jgi:hypothetical protein
VHDLSRSENALFNGNVLQIQFQLLASQIAAQYQPYSLALEMFLRFVSCFASASKTSQFVFLLRPKSAIVVLLSQESQRAHIPE